MTIRLAIARGERAGERRGVSVYGACKACPRSRRSIASTVERARGQRVFIYDSTGYLASQTDWNGNVTTYVNNAIGQPTSVTEAAGTSLTRTTTISYDTTFTQLPHQVVAPRETTNYTYDASGNLLTLTETDTSGGPTNGQTRTLTYTYDSPGARLDGHGPRTDVTQKTTYTYSGNNVATLTNALGQVTLTPAKHQRLPLSMTDPNGVVTTFTYDLKDRLLSRTVQAASGNATTTYAYDLWRTRRHT